MDGQRHLTAQSPSFRIDDPTGIAIRIPANTSEDNTYFTADQTEQIRRYYDENGYVVIRGLMPRTLCEAARTEFLAEVKPDRGFIYRQTTANPERHLLTEHGYVLNPILNIQSLDRRRFPTFRRAGMAILTHTRVQAMVRTLLDESGKLVQSMYFDGNPVTWPHQDTYYLDAQEIGRMTAAWFAAEDIARGAGRFFVYPKSHLIDLKKNGGDFDVAFHHARYKQLVIDVIRKHGLECCAPALEAGDALFWAAKTIHGSLPTSQPQFSRSSFTAHYIPESMGLLQFQSRLRPLVLDTVNGIQVHHPKDLNRWQNRAILEVETTFPKSFQAAKKVAIKLLTR